MVFNPYNRQSEPTKPFSLGDKANGTVNTAGKGVGHAKNNYMRLKCCIINYANYRIYIREVQI